MIEYLVKIFIFQIILSFLIIRISKELKLIDYPNFRKDHKFPVPYTGGIIIGTTYLFIVFITDYNENNLNLILSYSVLACFAGFIDDKYKVNPGTKIMLQTIPIILLVNQGLILNDIGDYYFFGKVVLGSSDKIFTIFCCLFLINSCNYSDGIDGLLSVITILILISFFFFLKFFYQVQIDYLIVILSPIIIFLFFNLINGKYKIFLGDSGSNLIGYLIGFISIILYGSYNLHPAIIIWPLAYLVYEFIAVNLNRALFKKKIFKPGKDHLHYEIKKKYNLNNLNVVFVILIINIIFASVGYYLFKNFLPDISLIVFFILFCIYFFLRHKIFNKTTAGN